MNQLGQDILKRKINNRLLKDINKDDYLTVIVKLPVKMSGFQPFINIACDQVHCVSHVVGVHC